MSPAPMFPPLDYSLLFYEIVNFQMQNNPTLPMLAYADDQAPDHHVTEITFLEFGRAAHRVATALCPRSDERRVVLLIANCDTIFYQVMVAGMLLAGLVPFVVSHRNSVAAVVDMMKKTHCSRIVTLHHAHHDLMEGIRQEMSNQELVIEELPTFSHVFPRLGKEVAADPFILHPGPASRLELDGPAMYFHSSGSTGFPKPILVTQKVLVSWLRQPLLLDFKRLFSFRRIGAMALPTFHAYGMVVQMNLSLSYLVTACVFAPRAAMDPHAPPVIPTSDNILDCVRWMGCSAVMTVPTFLEQWALSPKNVEELKKLDLVLYGGGPLAKKAGDDLCAAGVFVTALYGGTEFGIPINLRQRTDIEGGDWNWMCFSDTVDVRWIPYGNNTYECQVLSSHIYPLAVENIPDAKGYATSDLFVKHPTKNLWKIVGRVDDVITLASGEKTVPAPMESVINSCPMIQGSVMFGRERNQVGILIEPQLEYAIDLHDRNAIVEFREKIWPFVEEANATAPAFSRIFKEMTIITTPEKPLLRTPKGSIQKKAAIQAYEAEIDALYDAAGAILLSNGIVGPQAWTTDTLEGWLLEHANVINRVHKIDVKTDLFAQGFDSLSATYLRNQLLHALRASADSELRNAASHVSLNIVFENPTISLLATRVATLVGDDKALQESDFESHVTAMNDMIKKYSDDLPGSVACVNGATKTKTPTSETVVLLTGSTGGLGSFLLARLVENSEVKKIYAFNRPSPISSADRQASGFINKGLRVDLLKSDKLVYIEADMCQARCGLPLALYDEICGTVTTIIHNAWRVDFNLSLASFEANVKAARNLVDLALDSRHSHLLRFVFTSSVASAQAWDHERGALPEELQLDPSVAVGSGYGEAKYVCERIIVRSGLRATSLRIGQITGGSNGSWASTDWVPIIVKSSLALGALPSSNGVVSWMHAEDVAGAVLDVAFAGEDVPQVLNIVNPHHPTWQEIISFIQDAVLKNGSAMRTNSKIGMIPFVDWVSLVEKRANNATPQDMVDIPAIKLLEVLQGMARMEERTLTIIHSDGERAKVNTGGIADCSTTNAQRVSKSMTQMHPIGKMDAHAWVHYWASTGFL